MLSVFALKNTVLFSFLLWGCGISVSEDKTQTKEEQVQIQTSEIIVGANQTQAYLPFLKNKRVGIVANQTSVIFKKDKTHTHLVDSLVYLGVKVQKVFAPEHGFRGKADAGEHIKDGKDAQTGLPILSLYGNNKKPKPEQLADIDVMIFDIQDVGARFYTYISTLHYIMEACAEQQIPLLILDRPNPNGSVVDGPVLETENTSFVGMHPIPVLHGMTIAEYAQMINGEKWLGATQKCTLKLIACKNYTHSKMYSLPIKPSPNLPNDQSINLYASLCFFEGTDVSVGRGTDQQFQIYGSPEFVSLPYTFTPASNEGAKIPKHQGKLCYGENLTKINPVTQLELKWLLNAYQLTKNKETFFNDFFIKLAGTSQLQKQIESGLNTAEIRKSWQQGLDQFQVVRKKYLLYL